MKSSPNCCKTFRKETRRHASNSFTRSKNTCPSPTPLLNRSPIVSSRKRSRPSKGSTSRRETLKQLKDAAEQKPTRDEFGQPLRDALNDFNMTSLNWPLSELENAQDEASRKGAAGKAKEGLSKVSKAFTESEPQGLQAAQKAKPLQQEPKGSFERGMSQLDSLVKQAETKRQMSPQNQSKQGQEALYNLQNGFEEMFGSNERGNQILVRLEKELKKGESSMDAANIRKLMDELQNFSLELKNRSAKKEDEPDVTNIDSSKLPAAYRGRIEKYFQKLSEK